MRARVATGVVLGFAALFACAGPKYEDDDDSGGNGGNSGESASGGSSGTSSSSGGTGTQTGGAGGKGGASSGGASGTSGSSSATGGDGNATSSGGTGTSGGTGGASGGTGGDTGASGGTGGGNAGRNASGGTGGGMSGTGGDGGSSPITISFCNVECVTPADCVTSTSVSYDEDNYACTNGLCVYTGCNSDEECAASSPGYKCAHYGTSVPVCAMVCVSAADCALGIPSYDTDNMLCEDGGCFYLGCNTDEECQATYEGYLCRETRLGVRSCSAPCSTAADCSLDAPTYRENNYACENGACIWVGCQADSECQEISLTYVCR